MKLFNKNIIFLLILLISVITACAVKDVKKFLVGGPCDYEEIEGTAVITSIVDAQSDDYNCHKRPVKVSFVFTPDDSSAKGKYLFPNVSDSRQNIRLSGGLNPPKDFMKVKGIIVGTSHKCVRKEIIKGTCTPVLYEFPEIDFSGYAKYCW
jgi:hypothetical protein